MHNCSISDQLVDKELFNKFKSSRATTMFSHVQLTSMTLLKQHCIQHSSRTSYLTFTKQQLFDKTFLNSTKNLKCLTTTQQVWTNSLHFFTMNKCFIIVQLKFANFVQLFMPLPSNCSVDCEVVHTGTTTAA